MSILLCPRYDGAALADGDVAISDVELEGNPFVMWSIGNDGFTYGLTGGVGPSSQLGSWIDPQAGMDLYEAMATPTSTKRPNVGTYNTWLDLAQSWTWGFQETPLQQRQDQLGIMPSASGAFQVDIRRKSDQVIVATINVLLTLVGNDG